MAFIVFLLGSLATSVCAADREQARRTLTVGVEAQAFAPHYFIDGQGEYRGYARDLLDRFAAANGLQLIYKPMPVDNLLPALLAGRIDLQYPDNANWGGSLKAGKPVSYSLPLTEIIDGVLVPPARRGRQPEDLERLAAVDGWTLPADSYGRNIQEGTLVRVSSADLNQLMKTTLRGDADGAFFNVVVATYYLDNLRARPGALVFDPALPYVRSGFSLSTVRHPEVIRQMDAFLQERAAEVTALKERHQVETNIGTEFMGMEQWKIDFIKRQRARQAKNSAQAG
jgi:ABC-type amino acid transport substrate-binding protein